MNAQVTVAKMVGDEGADECSNDNAMNTMTVSTEQRCYPFMVSRTIARGSSRPDVMMAF